MQHKEEEEEKILVFTLGNIEPGQRVDVSIERLEQAKILEGSYNLSIPKGMVLMLTERREHS